MCAATLQGLQLQLQLGPAAGIDGCCCCCCATASTARHPTQTRHVQLPRSLLATYLGTSRSTVAWLASYRGIQCLQYTWLDESIDCHATQLRCSTEVQQPTAAAAPAGTVQWPTIAPLHTPHMWGCSQCTDTQERPRNTQQNSTALRQVLLAAVAPAVAVQWLAPTALHHTQLFETNTHMQGERHTP